MEVEIRVTAKFLKSLKPLLKKYASIESDYQELIKQLKENPTLGIDLGAGLRKVRMAIASKGKGKSGSARVITFTVIVASDDQATVNLITIYDKSDISSINVSSLKKILKELDLAK